MAVTMPAQRPGKSKQDYGTPREFLDAVERRWGPIHYDMAASVDNAKAPLFFTEAMNSLDVPGWPCGNLWLNPPFNNIRPWAVKCGLESLRSPRSRILFLTPASVGSNWFEYHVLPFARVCALTPRLTFEGCSAPYPKDCILSVYGDTPGFEVWRWK